MPYYNDVPFYYGGGAYANHSSLMTGTGRTPFHLPLPRFAPHLSTISESPLNHLHRFSPISMRHTRRVIDTADIDVSTPRILSHDGHRPRNRLRRDRPTIKIRSQALKDNPALRKHNEKHEKSVGELLMEKFLIKDKKLSDDKNQQVRLYHQINLDCDEKSEPLEREALQKRVTRRFTRRRSSTDLDPEQLRREATYAQVQAKVLDNLVAEEQAQIENETRCGTLIRKGTTINCSYCVNSADSDTMTHEEEEAVATRMKKAMKKARKKKKSIVDKITDDVLDNRRSSTCSDTSTDSRIENEVKPQMFKIEACNSAGDFSTIWVNANVENEKCKSTTVDEFKGEIQNGSASPRSADEAETQIVLSVKKPYVKDSSSNSVYLTMRKPTEKLDEKLEELEKLDAKNDESQVSIINGFVYATDNFKNDTLESLTGKNLSELNGIKDTALEKIADEIESLVKKDVSFLSNENSRNKQDIVSRTKSDVQNIDAEDNSSKNIETNLMQSSTSAFVSTNAQQNNMQIKQLSLLKDTFVTRTKKDRGQQNDSAVDSMKTSLEVSSSTKTAEFLINKNLVASKMDKFVEEKNRLKFLTVSQNRDISIEDGNNADKNNTNSAMLVLNSAACRLPKASKINVDRNNAVEAPELSLRETTEYLANSPKSAEDVVRAAVLPGKKANKALNLAQVPSTDSLKKANGVDTDNKSTFKIDASQRNNAAKLEIKKMTLLKETNCEVRINDHNEEMKKDIDLKKASRNNVGKPNENTSYDLSLQPSVSLEKMEINIETSADVPKESKLLKADIKKINGVDLRKDTSRDSELSSFTSKTAKLNSAESKVKTLQSKTAMNEASNATDLKKVGKNLGVSKIVEVDDGKLTSLHKKDINAPRILKKNISVDSLKPTNECSSSLSNPNNLIVSQQLAFANGKDKITPIKKTLKSLKPLNKVMEEKLTINASCEKSPLEDGQLSKSASTESIDFWNEIKAPESPEATMIDFKIEQKTNLTIPKRVFDDSPVKESDSEKNDVSVKINVATSSGPAVIEGERKEGKIVLENLGAKKAEAAKEKNCTLVQKTAPKKKNLSIVIGAKNSNSTVKKAPLKRDNSINSIQSDLTDSKISFLIPEITVPIINIIEVSKLSEKSENCNIDEEHEDPSTPTNELLPAPSLTGKISQCNQDDLTNADDVETPVVSEETSLTTSPSLSPQSSKIKRTIKKKLSTKKTSSPPIKNNRETKEAHSNESITNQQNTHKSEKQLLAKPSTKTSPKSSPRNSPSQRPLDLIRMFYTTPSALLTATPRDLSKVRRAKIKRRRHHSRTPSVSSDSTGSTTSTATNESTDGSGSTCTELDDDAEHKRMNSTRSNDSGFDGSPRISTPSQSSENQRNSDSSDHFPTGRITPPATNLPRFKKYAVTDFNFLKVLGKGSFGKVLLAELRGTECVYAVKCLKKDVVLEDDDVECTLIERKVLTLATRHPYLCHLFCTFQTDSHLFFVMEYLNGGDLMFHIQKSGRFPETRARFYAAEIWSGLNFLHKKGIVYRDLKLDNVLLDFEGHIRIADFGMCKLQIFLDRTADTFCGTPDYMAPEVIKGLKYNQAVDWWSYGVLLYEMLTGQSPFSGCDEDELFWSICNERPFIPRYLSQEASDILICLLEKDSGKRPPGHEIAMHAFFQHLPWDRLERRQLEPPFKPALDHTLDTKYFDTAFTTERPRLTPVPEQILISMDQGVFRGFSYTNPNATD
ncbi:uncharacterized protein [Linepithema humile]|uniref:uncharacterized protein isoform X2 n=1 Tax=Linepithema humile TaxID=83485 RepID=UPI00351EF6E4